tara:strand:- start:3002 stop:3184 length:183 start_codon:yes stop_codon:yes gene_type:complete
MSDKKYSHAMSVTFMIDSDLKDSDDILRDEADAVLARFREVTIEDIEHGFDAPNVNYSHE